MPAFIQTFTTVVEATCLLVTVHAGALVAVLARDWGAGGRKSMCVLCPWQSEVVAQGQGGLLFSVLSFTQVSTPTLISTQISTCVDARVGH